MNAEPSHLWPLLALAEAESLDRVSAYRITAASLRGALRRGLAFDQVIRFLESRTGGPLPEAVRVTLDDWVRAVRRVVLESAVILSADDAGTLAETVALARATAIVEMLPDGRAVVRVLRGDEELTAWLKEAYSTPVWKPPQPFANRPG